MKKTFLGFNFSLILLLSLGIVFADTNGVWTDASDTRGGVDRGIFGGDENSQYQDFWFKSGDLTIGIPGENNPYFSFVNNIQVGVAGSDFEIRDGAGNLISINSQRTLIPNDLFVQNNVRANVYRPLNSALNSPSIEFQGSNVIVTLG